MYVMVQDVRQLGPSERASRDSTKFRVASQDCPANVSSDQEVGAGERGEATDEQEVRGMYDADQPRTSVRGERNVDLQILQDPEIISIAEVRAGVPKLDDNERTVTIVKHEDPKAQYSTTRPSRRRLRRNLHSTKIPPRPLLLHPIPGE